MFEDLDTLGAKIAHKTTITKNSKQDNTKYTLILASDIGGDNPRHKSFILGAS